MNYGVLVDEAYTVYWPQDRWRRALSVGRPLEILFGGPHQSAPSFACAEVSPGDVLYPIGVYQQTLLAFGRMRVRTLVTATPQAYLDRCPHWRFSPPRRAWTKSCSARTAPSCSAAAPYRATC